MPRNVIEEYLVGLGFNIDTVGYQRFTSMLRDVAGLVDNQYLRMFKSVVTFETAAIGAFAAVGAGVVGLADKVAMADQEYRLLALRMYTSLPVARELKIALDALGQPLENVIWDPELARRFAQLVKDQQTMMQELGPGFENQMLKIRDVRFEFTRFGVELKYLTMLVVEDLAKAFGTSIDGLLEKMRGFNEYVIRNLPGIANWIATNLKPILIDTKDIFSAIWDVVKQLAVDFTNLFAIITGDRSMMGQTVNWKNFAQAVEVTIDTIGRSTVSFLHLAKNLALLFDAALQAGTGNFSAAVKDLSQMQAIDVFGMSKPTDLKPGATAGTAPLTGAGPGLATKANIRAAIIAQATALGVPPELALAVAQEESGFKQFDPRTGGILTSKKGALGVMQLMPSTALGLGVDPNDVGQNIYGGIELLRDLLKANKGNVERALREYAGGTPGLAAMNKEAGQYAKDVMRIESGIHIDKLEINVGSGDPHTVKQAVRDGINEAERARILRSLNEFGSPAWGY